MYPFFYLKPAKSGVCNKNLKIKTKMLKNNN